MAKLQKSKYLLRNLVIQQKNVQKNWLKWQQIIHFEKPLTQQIQTCKNHCKNF